MNQTLILPFLTAPPALEMAFLLLVGLVATFTAIMAVTRRNPLYGAVFLIAFFISVAILYLELAAPFIGILQVLIYGGAIMVLYTFIIMLLDLSPRDQRVYIQAPTPGAEPASGTGIGEDERTLNIGAFIVSFGTFLCIAIPVVHASRAGFFTDLEAPAKDFGSAEVVGAEMFTEFALPFELVGLMLLVAAIAGVVLAKHKISDSAEDTGGMGRGLAS